MSVAAPGFIAGSFVDGDEKTARMSVQFRCGVEYLGHEPSDHGDSLRIRLESTQEFAPARHPGIARSIVNSTAPSGQIAARLLKPRISTATRPAGKDTCASISARMSTSISSSHSTTTPLPFTSRSMPMQAPEDQSCEHLNVAARCSDPPLPTTKYVINLESSLRPPATADIPSLALDR